MSMSGKERMVVPSRESTPVPVDFSDDQDTPEKTSPLEPHFRYLALTQDPDTTSPLVQKLNVIAGQMCKGTYHTCTVVLLRKGTQPRGFVYQDGTIFINQALVNKLDTLDELASIIAHEVGHIINETSRRQGGVTGDDFEKAAKRFGIGWTHEMASDTMTPELLQKAGLNSMALTSAIQKISDSGRGIEHQGGVTRAAQVVAVHTTLNYKYVPPTPYAAAGIIKQEVKPTNLELIERCVTTKDIQGFSENLSKLHPRDLHSVLDTLHGSAPEFVDSYYNYLKERWKASELSDMECKVLFYALVRGSKSMTLLTPTPDETQALISAALAGDHYKLNKARKATFGAEDYDVYFDSYTVLQQFEGCVELAPSKDGVGYVVDEAALVASMKALQDKGTGGDYKNVFVRTMSDLVAQFLHQSCVRESSVVETAKRLARTLKENKIELDRNSFISAIARLTVSSNDRYKSTLRAFFEVFFSGESKMARAQEIAKSSIRYPRGDDLKALQELLTGESFTDEEKKELLSYVDSQIELEPKETLDAALARKLNGHAVGGEDEASIKAGHILRQLSVRIVFAKAIYPDAGGRYYEYLHTIFENVRPAVDSCTLMGKTRLLTVLLRATGFLDQTPFFSQYGEFFHQMELKQTETDDFDELEKIPFVKDIMQSHVSREIKPTPRDILRELDDAKRRYFEFKKSSGPTPGPFSEDPIAVMVYAPLRKALQTYIEQGVIEKDFAELGDLVSRLYAEADSSRVTQWLQAIDQTVLRSSEISFDKKTDYLVSHFDRIGVEGALLLASEIKTPQEYVIFRNKLKGRVSKYLNGSDNIIKAAVLDNVTSLFADQRLLFAASTDNAAEKKNITNSFAIAWLETHVGWDGGKKMVNDQIAVGYVKRPLFLSFADSVFKLKNLSEGERFGLALRALTDVNGSLTDPKRKQTFIANMLESLRVTDPFVQRLLTIGITNGEPDFISFPITRAQVPLLFRGLDMDALDVKSEAASNYALSVSRAEKILKSDTRSLMVFGEQYRAYPHSTFFSAAQDSNRSYDATSGKLDSILLERSGDKAEPLEKIGIPLESEALMRAVEKAGGMGVRMMQIASQILDVSDPLRERMSQAFDANEGMSKLVFWENLHRHAEKDPHIKAFMGTIVSLDDYLGGGSLYTTFKAVVRHEGADKEVALKMVNPNAQAIILKTHALITNTLEEIASQGSEYEKSLATALLVAANLSREWCLSDLHDPRFEKDDDQFAAVVEAFNSERGEKVMFMPTRVFNHQYVKVETMAGYATLNQVLKNKEISESDKKRLLEEKIRFGLFQLRNAPSFVDEKGRSYREVHSDPSVGNYMKGDRRGMMGVTDRNMYVRVFEGDTAVLERLFNGDYFGFLNSFVNRILEVNDVKDVADQERITMKVGQAAMREVQRQMTIGSSSPELIMSEVLTTLSEVTFSQGTEPSKINVPLAIRLLLRNIIADMKLAERYGMDFSALGIKAKVAAPAAIDVIPTKKNTENQPAKAEPPVKRGFFRNLLRR